jgi:hypothetical protein
MPSVATVKVAPVNMATAASNPILAAAGVGNKIQVVRFFLVAAGAVVVTFQSAANALSGPMTMATGIPFTYDSGDTYGRLFETNPNEALNLLLGTAVQVSGFVGYAIGR